MNTRLKTIKLIEKQERVLKYELVIHEIKIKEKKDETSY